MTLNDYANRFLPPYHDTMFLEGFKPWEIVEAAHRSIYQEYQDRKAQEPAEVKITGGVNVK